MKEAGRRRKRHKFKANLGGKAASCFLKSKACIDFGNSSCFVLSETGSNFVSLASLELAAIQLPRPTEYWGLKLDATSSGLC